MRRFYPFGIFLFAACLLWACAGNPQPGDPGYRYNVSGDYGTSMVVDGTPYSGTLTLATGAGGGVSGKMKLSSPLPLESDLSGTVVADSLRLTIPYILPDGCNGTATLTGAIADGGAGVAGDMTVDDSCAGPMSGTFTLTR